MHGVNSVFSKNFVIASSNFPRLNCFLLRIFICFTYAQFDVFVAAES